MTAIALLFTLSAIGLAETAYLIRERINQRAAACVIGSDCSTVLESKYNKFVGVHTDVWGFLFYLSMAIISGLLVVGVGPLSWWLLIFKVNVFLASFITLLLVYLQWRVIKVWCFWCLMSAGTILLMDIIIVVSNI